MIKYLQGFGSYGFNTDFSFRSTITEIARKGPFSLPNLGGFFYHQRHRKEIVCGTHSAKELLPSYGYERPHTRREEWNPESELGRMTPGLRASYVTRDETVHDLRSLDWMETLRLVHDYEREAAHVRMPVNLFPPPTSLKLFWQAAGHQLSLRDFVSDIPLERKIMEASEDVCRRLARQSHRTGKWLTMGEVMGEAITTANWYRNHLPMFQLRPYQQPLVDYFAGKK
jgi:hypothetical protein